MRVAIYARVSTANNGQDPERVHRAPRLSVGRRVRGRGNQRIRRRSPRALDGSKTPDCGQMGSSLISRDGTRTYRRGDGGVFGQAVERPRCCSLAEPVSWQIVAQDAPLLRSAAIL